MFKISAKVGTNNVEVTQGPPSPPWIEIFVDGERSIQLIPEDFKFYVKFLNVVLGLVEDVENEYG